jgi:argininosuccinate lyase
VPSDTKLYARKKLLELREKVAACVEVFLEKAKGREEDVMVVYTHVQHAQPASVAFWLSQYASNIIRDLDRLKAAYDLMNQNILGSGGMNNNYFFF